MERWADIPDYNGKYQISNRGNVRNNYGELLNKYINNGYYCVSLKLSNNKSRLTQVHRLVAKVFIDNPYDKPLVNHIDSNKLNNSDNNLEWVTPKENSQHSIRHDGSFRYRHLSNSASIETVFEV